MGVAGIKRAVMMEHFAKGQPDMSQVGETYREDHSLPAPCMLVTSRESIRSMRRFGLPDLDVGGLPLFSLSLCLASRALR